MKIRSILFKAFSAFLLSSSLVGYSHAAGTAAGTSVQTTYTIDYDVSSVAQTQISSSSSAFLIGRKIDLDVSQDAASFNVTPGGTDQFMTFTLTNNGNATQGYMLDSTIFSDSNGIITGNAVTIYIEEGSTVGFQVGEDTAYTEGTFAVDLDADDSIKIYVVADIESDAQSAETATIYLLAETTNAGTNTPVTDQSGVAWNAGQTQNVFADGEGIGSIEDPQDAKHSDSSVYTVGNANLSVSQTVLPLYDYNASASPSFCKDFASGSAQANAKVIPDGCVLFTYTLTNNGNTAADDIVWTITLPTELTYVGAENALEGEDTANATACDDTGNFDDTNGTTTGFICYRTTLAGSGGNISVKFRATVD